MTNVAASLLAILMKDRGAMPGSRGGAWSSYVATGAVSPVLTPGAAGLLQLLWPPHAKAHVPQPQP
jgi:hypothetical protein